MKDFLLNRRIDQIMIPDGMTGYFQTLYIAVKKPIKNFLREETDDYIEHRMERNVYRNTVKPNLKEVATWVENVWRKISDSLLANALRVGYLDKKYSFKDTLSRLRYQWRYFINRRQDLGKIFGYCLHRLLDEVSLQRESRKFCQLRTR